VWCSFSLAVAATWIASCSEETPGPDPEVEPQLEQPAPPSGQELFLEHCAACHGPAGAGDGETELVLPARSFQRGNFTWGNTPEALARTVRDGLPGRSPMPPFVDVLDEAEIERVVTHVRSLLPAEESVSAVDMRADVSDAPALLHGMLPAVGGAGELETRGLLLGFPGGLSLELIATDLRLRAARRGDFAERTDWEGRGGTPLAPLGELVHLYGDGAPPPGWERASAGGPRALFASLRSTWVRGGVVGLEQLLRGGGREAVQLSEQLETERIPDGLGYRRSFELGPGEGELYLRVPLSGEHTRSEALADHGWSFERPDGSLDVVLASAPLLLTGGADLRLQLELDPDGYTRARLLCAWQPADAELPLDRLLQELSR